MLLYGYAGELLASDIALPELAAEAARGDAPPRWTCGPGDIVAKPGAPLTHTDADDDDVTRRVVALSGGGWIVDFAIGATFQVTDHRITWSAPSTIEPAVLRHLLLDHTLPLALSTQPGLVLHASCVAMEGSIVAFMGPSGAGKSTTAAACLARGAAVIADDCIIVNGGPGTGWTAAPTYSGLRLWPDAAHRYGPAGLRHPVRPDSAKCRMPTAPPAAGPFPLTRLYVLERAPGATRVAAPAGAAAAMDVLRHEFRLDVDDRDMLARHFDQACAMVRAGLVCRLIVPEHLDAVDAAVDAVLADLRALRVSECA